MIPRTTPPYRYHEVRSRTSAWVLFSKEQYAEYGAAMPPLDVMLCVDAKKSDAGFDREDRERILRETLEALRSLIPDLDPGKIGTPRVAALTIELHRLSLEQVRVVVDFCDSSEGKIQCLFEGRMLRAISPDLGKPSPLQIEDYFS